MQLFRSEEEIDAWSKTTGHSKGAVFSPGQLWELAKRWWDDRLEFDWSRRTIAERQDILGDVGLTGEFWDLTARRTTDNTRQ